MYNFMFQAFEAQLKSVRSGSGSAQASPSHHSQQQQPSPRASRCEFDSTMLLRCLVRFITVKQFCFVFSFLASVYDSFIGFPNCALNLRILLPHFHLCLFVCNVSVTVDVKSLQCDVGVIKLRVKYGDICKERCDAIVNSTNAKLDLSVGRSICNIQLYSPERQHTQHKRTNNK